MILFCMGFFCLFILPSSKTMLFYSLESKSEFKFLKISLKYNATGSNFSAAGSLSKNKTALVSQW